MYIYKYTCMSNDCAQRTNVSMYRLYKEITYSDIFSVHALVSSVFSCVKNLVFIVKGKRQPNGEEGEGEVCEQSWPYFASSCPENSMWCVHLMDMIFRFYTIALLHYHINNLLGV